MLSLSCALDLSTQLLMDIGAHYECTASASKSTWKLACQSYSSSNTLFHWRKLSNETSFIWDFSLLPIHLNIRSIHSTSCISVHCFFSPVPQLLSKFRTSQLLSSFLATSFSLILFCGLHIFLQENPNSLAWSPNPLWCFPIFFRIFCWTSSDLSFKSSGLSASPTTSPELPPSGLCSHWSFFQESYTIFSSCQHFSVLFSTIYDPAPTLKFLPFDFVQMIMTASILLYCT